MKPGLFPLFYPSWLYVECDWFLLSPTQAVLLTSGVSVDPYPGSPPTSGWRLLCSRSRFEVHMAQVVGILGVSGTHQRHPQFIDRNLDVF